MPDETRLPLPDEQIDDSYDFEKAMETCGFGIFNIGLLLASMLGLWACVFEAAIMSFIIPAAECDLNLSLIDKGALNAISFGGMLVAGFGWAFIADTFGRKYILVIALTVIGVWTLCSVVSQTATDLMVFKFFGGFFACGPLAVFFSYISEFHGKKHRVYIGISIGLLNALPLIILPTIATLLLPHKINYKIFNFEMNAWKTFIAISAIPSLLSAFLLMFFPESPKFLMTQGRNNKAINVFRTVYAVNKFKRKDDYPITHLIDEAPIKSQRHSQYSTRLSFSEKKQEFKIELLEGVQQLKILCTRTHLKKTFLACSMHFPLALSVYSMRLWQPQYFATLREMLYKGIGDISTCNIIDYSLNKSRIMTERDLGSDHECKTVIQEISYIDSIKIAGAICINYVLTTIFVRLVDNNVLLRIYMSITSVCLLMVYWSQSLLMAILLFSFVSAFGMVCLSLVLNTSINLYPTSMRTMALVTLMTCGRAGVIIGNLLLPILMSVHCVAAFAVYSVAIVWSFTISFFLPNTTKEELK